ncbi:MAG: amidohydrolase [Steroidobacteraceae bacterium]
MIACSIARRCAIVAATVAAALCLPVAIAEAPPALLLTNGNIYTGVTAQPRAEAVLAVDGRIAFVGDKTGALALAPGGARTVDLRGKTVFPGFADAHAHLSDIGWRELNFDLTGVESIAALQARLRERAAKDRSAWIVGVGWIESKWSPAEFPTREDLDAVVTSRPVVLERADGHAVIASTLALKIAGIGPHTPDPAGGQILRDPRTGLPTGMLIDTAMDLVQRHVPPVTDEDLALALETGARRSVRLGWTELQIAGTTWQEIEQLCRLYAAGRLNLRLYAAIGGPGADAENLLTAGRNYKSCDPRLTVRAIKLYIDGALGSRGAALEEPYSDAPDTRGLFVTPPEEILRIAIAGLKSGIQIETHAIGDRGNRLLLDQYEKAFAAVPKSERPVPDPRFRIEHAQVVSAKDMPRFAQLGVIASMQTSHAISDMLFAPARLGPGRIAGAYAWRSLLDAGALIAGGSDAPVEQGDPLVEFYAAVARRTLEGFAGPDWRLDQRLTRDEALAVLTSGPAYAAFEEKDRGTIAPGKLADLSVFSADLMKIPEAEIPRARAVMTVIGGEIVHSAPGDP